MIRLGILFVLFLAFTLTGFAQERFSPFVPSNEVNVERMVKIANLRAGETVMDLGSGDGRIVIAAAQAQSGVRGIGVDIDAELVQKSNADANRQGLADRVRFEHRNAFDADLRNADVIFMWLFPELMRLLRPKILAEAKPGARIVAATWDMGNWPVDAADDLAGAPTIRMWIVPARIEGEWEWEVPVRGESFQYGALFEQRIQQVEGAVRMGVRRELLTNVHLRGDTLQFTLRMTLPKLGYVTQTYVGRVQGDRIEGTAMVQMSRPGDEDAIEEIRIPWRARRPTLPRYFAPTGTKLL
ncbi:MAG: methyltransferase domain-containing protein [Betaproteobacteria bacterium]|nr:methyltransferase domain-containing protein [Betaproteobacteria bacterium]